MRVWTIAALALLLTACGSAAAPPRGTSTAASTSPATQPAATSPAVTSPAVTSPAATQPRWQHIVVLVLENRNSTSIIGSVDAPYLNQLARSGLDFTDMHGETHPSQPNYVALFSGSTQGLTDDSCPHTYDGANLAAQLSSAGHTFVGYAEHLPSPGYTGCDAYPYARRHVPWADFATVPAGASQPLTAWPSDYAQLPSVAFVVPDVVDDMHDGTVAQGDAWVRVHLQGYVDWAANNRSLLLVTWDEDEDTAANHIATFAVGAGVSPGKWTSRADHYTLLATIEDAFGLPRLGAAAKANVPTPLGD